MSFILNSLPVVEFFWWGKWGRNPGGWGVNWNVGKYSILPANTSSGLLFVTFLVTFFSSNEICCLCLSEI